MSDTLEIVVSGSLPSPQIELSVAAFNARTLALEASGRIKAIASVADLDSAAAALTSSSVTPSGSVSRMTRPVSSISLSSGSCHVAF
jgi:hypothetical protein